MTTRKNLARKNGQRLRWTAEVSRRGRGSRDQETMLLLDVRQFSNNQPMTDHLWVKVGQWNRLLTEGQRIAFDARIDDYRKGYADYRTTDYHLEFPSKVCVLDQEGNWQAAPRPPKETRAIKEAYRRKREQQRQEQKQAPATDAQIRYLTALQGDIAPADGLTREQASEAIEALVSITGQCHSTTKVGRRCLAKTPGHVRYCAIHRADSKPV